MNFESFGERTLEKGYKIAHNIGGLLEEEKVLPVIIALMVLLKQALEQQSSFNVDDICDLLKLLMKNQEEENND